MGKRELIALLNLSSWCLVMVERLFLTVPQGCLQFVIVVFPDHTHYFYSRQGDSPNFLKIPSNFKEGGFYINKEEKIFNFNARYSLKIPPGFRILELALNIFILLSTILMKITEQFSIFQIVSTGIFLITVYHLKGCLFELVLYISVNKFSVMSRNFLGWRRTKQKIKCLAQCFV